MKSITGRVQGIAAKTVLGLRNLAHGNRLRILNLRGTKCRQSREDLHA